MAEIRSRIQTADEFERKLEALNLSMEQSRKNQGDQVTIERLIREYQEKFCGKDKLSKALRIFLDGVGILPIVPRRFRTIEKSLILEQYLSISWQKVLIEQLGILAPNLPGDHLFHNLEFSPFANPTSPFLVIFGVPVNLDGIKEIGARSYYKEVYYQTNDTNPDITLHVPEDDQQPPVLIIPRNQTIQLVEPEYDQVKLFNRSSSWDSYTFSPPPTETPQRIQPGLFRPSSAPYFSRA